MVTSYPRSSRSGFIERESVNSLSTSNTFSVTSRHLPLAQRLLTQAIILYHQTYRNRLKGSIREIRFDNFGVGTNIWTPAFWNSLPSPKGLEAV
jgi:hypothetical protein